MILQLPGERTPEQFLARYWQERHLLRLVARRALPAARHSAALCRILPDWYLGGWLHAGLLKG